MPVRLSLREKLSFGLLLPIVGVYGLVAYLSFRDARATALEGLARSAHDRAAVHVARLDASLSSAAQLAATLAASLEAGPKLEETAIRSLLTRLLRDQPETDAAAVLFAPFRHRSTVRLFAPTATRRERDDTASAGPNLDTFDAAEPTPSDQRPADYSLDPEGPYVAAVRAAQAAGSTTPLARPGIWTEPRPADRWTGQGRAPLVVSRAVAFRSASAPETDPPTGVIRVDLRLSPLIAHALQHTTPPSGDLPAPAEPAPQLDMGVLVLSRRGSVLAHPDAEWIGRPVRASAESGTADPSSSTDNNRNDKNKSAPAVAGAPAAATPARVDPRFDRLVRGMLAAQSGTIRFTDPATEQAMLGAFAPVGSSGWSLAVVLPEDAVLAPVRRQLAASVSVMGAGLLLIAALLFFSFNRLIYPLRKLADAIREVGRGDLSHSTPGARSRAARGADEAELGDLAGEFSSMLERLRGQLSRAEERSASRTALESELRLARDLQLSLRPAPLPVGLLADVRVHAVTTPARFVGGDFFDYFPLPDGRLALVVADVSGKGVHAAMFMAVTRTIIRDALRQDAAPGPALRRANPALLESNHEAMFVTVFAGIYDPRSGVVRFANAGHPPPILVQRSRPDAARTPVFHARPVAGATGPVLAAFEATPVEEQSLQLMPGDRLVLYTDGVPEATAPTNSAGAEGSPARGAPDQFGLRRWTDFCAAYAGEGPEAFCQRVVAHLDAFQHGSLHDDLTLLVLDRLR